MNSPFHPGETYVQSRLGFAEQSNRIGQKFIRSQIPDQHRDFFESQPFVFIGAVDETGHPWASYLAGPKGFISAPTDQQLVLRASLPTDDPLYGHLQKSQKIGMIGIEPHTRRRNRLNGRINRVTDERLVLDIDQSFGNCPKYIQRRKIGLRQQSGESYTCDTLCEDLRSTIKNADIFFITSRTKEMNQQPNTGVDMSHRGGERGFVKVIDEHWLSFADYPGNRFFNTLGNIHTDPRIGLLFLDFDNHRTLHIKATAEIQWIQQERNILVHVDHVLVRPNPTLCIEEFL
ncbi:MAG: pyridoxamine 5'-phosphate oxidase family protein [Methylocystaceae bacterium]|nr:pyridoxamine 5'-phosphate oxidase family protein [Methylocystaceae bacterium]